LESTQVDPFFDEALRLNPSRDEEAWSGSRRAITTIRTVIVRDAIDRKARGGA
jgi:hypothetical protein